MNEHLNNNLKKQEAIYIDGLLPYLLYKPEHISGPWPILFFLHGWGERGSDLELLNTTGLAHRIEHSNLKALDFLVISPQCPIDETLAIDSKESGWWTNPDKMQDLELLFEDSLSRYSVDPTRVYMTGLSMGGFATWEFATKHADKLAAIAPICGGGTPQKASALTQLPIWAFHGADDDIVPVGESLDMIQAIRELGGEPELTVYLDTKHDSWTRTYAKDELFEWFLQHSL